jgi:hypothetical protein
LLRALHSRTRSLCAAAHFFIFGFSLSRKYALFLRLLLCVAPLTAGAARVAQLFLQ